MRPPQENFAQFSFLHIDAACAYQAIAGDVRRFVGGEEQRGVGDLLLLALAPQGRAPLTLLVACTWVTCRACMNGFAAGVFHLIPLGIAPLVFDIREREEI